jgi:hypothetical protein
MRDMLGLPWPPRELNVQLRAWTWGISRRKIAFEHATSVIAGISMCPRHVGRLQPLSVRPAQSPHGAKTPISVTASRSRKNCVAFIQFGQIAETFAPSRCGQEMYGSGARGYTPPVEVWNAMRAVILEHAQRWIRAISMTGGRAEPPRVGFRQHESAGQVVAR